MAEVPKPKYVVVAGTAGPYSLASRDPPKPPIAHDSVTGERWPVRISDAKVARYLRGRTV